MLKGKHIVIVVGILLLLLINYEVYNSLTLATENEIRNSSGCLSFCQLIIIIEGVFFIFIIMRLLLCNWDKIWNWEFNLKKWL
jgi:hypothetical protein